MDETRLAALRDRFKDDGLVRLSRAEAPYYSTHGHYLPELALLLLAERAELVGCRDRVEQDAKAWDKALRDACARLVAAEARVKQLQRLLKRLAEWDHMQTAADGPYWLREIAAALAGSHPEPPQQSAASGAPSGGVKPLCCRDIALLAATPACWWKLDPPCPRAASAALPSPAPETTDAEGLSAASGAGGETP